MWPCATCSFHNSNDSFLACAACGSERLEAPIWKPSDLDFLMTGISPQNATSTSTAATSKPGYVPASAKSSVSTTAALRTPHKQQQQQPHPPAPALVVLKPRTLGAATSKPPPPPPPRPSSPPPPPPAATAAAPPPLPKDKLKPILDELVESERTYVIELQAIVSVFLLPLKQRAQDHYNQPPSSSSSSDSLLISESDCNAIFGNVNEILRLNLDLLAAFDRVQPAASSSSSQRAIELCKVFQAFVPHLKMYAFYAITFDEGAALLKRLEDDRAKFRDFLHTVSSNNSLTNSQPLSSFLIKPIQRVCKYPLFFHQLLRQLDDDEDGAADSELRQVVKTTMAAAGDVATRINQDKLRAEHNLRAFEVARKVEFLSAVVLEPGRRYVGEWKCLMSAASAGGEADGGAGGGKKRRSSTLSMMMLGGGGSGMGERKSRTCFLFNNALLVCKEVVASSSSSSSSSASSRHQLKLWISLDQLQLCGINDDTQPVAATETPSTAAAAAAADNNNNNHSDGFRSNSKQFKLPLSIVHAALGDRALTANLRERQQAELHASQPLASLTRQLVRKKSSSTAAAAAGGGEEVKLCSTMHTMWFRSPAERARVHALLQLAYKDFATPAAAAAAVVVTVASPARFPPNSPLSGQHKVAVSEVSSNGHHHSPVRSPSSPRAQLVRQVSAPEATRRLGPPPAPPVRAASAQLLPRSPEQRRSRPRPPPPPPPPPPSTVVVVASSSSSQKDALTSKWFD